MNVSSAEIFSCIIYTLVVWRLTHLFSFEDGPFDLIFLIRRKAGNSFFGKLLDCFYCTSIWVSLPFGLYFGTNLFDKIFYWIAFSGAACLLEQATAKKNNDERIPDYKED